MSLPAQWDKKDGREMSPNTVEFPTMERDCEMKY